MFKYVSAKGIKKIIVGVILLLAVVAIIKTNSRGAFLGLMAVFFVTITQIKIQGEKVLIKIFIASIFVVGAVLYFGGDEYYERISTMLNPEQDYNVSSTHGRIQIWLRGLDMIITNPVLGVGIGNYRSIGDKYAPAGMDPIGSRIHLHNLYLQIAVETGLLGLATLYYLLFLFIFISQKCISIRRVCIRGFSNLP